MGRLRSFTRCIAFLLSAGFLVALPGVAFVLRQTVASGVSILNLAFHIRPSTIIVLSTRLVESRKLGEDEHTPLCPSSYRHSEVPFMTASSSRSTTIFTSGLTELSVCTRRSTLYHCENEINIVVLSDEMVDLVVSRTNLFVDVLQFTLLKSTASLWRPPCIPHSPDFTHRIPQRRKYYRKSSPGNQHHESKYK